MTIRRKFILALIVAVLLPASFISLMGLYSTLHLSKTLARDQREHLLLEAQGVMKTAIHKNVAAMERMRSVFATAGAIQSSHARMLLEGTLVSHEPAYKPSDFRPGGSAPGLAESQLHTVINPTEYAQAGPPLVSYKVPVTFVGQGGSAKRAQQLAGLGPAFRALAPSLDGVAIWQFVTLDTGEGVVYPGHGLLPDAYDPRQSPVYKRSRPILSYGSGSSPSIDPATGQPLVGWVAPVTDSQGKTIGMTGILSRVDTVLEGFRFGTQWGNDAETMFVYAGKTSRTDDKDKLYIIVRKAYTQKNEKTSGFLGIDTFQADDPSHTDAIINAIKGTKYGHLEITLNGQPMLCCFEGMEGDQTGLITLVPIASINTIADQAARRIRSQAINLTIGMLLSAVVFSLLIMLAAVLGIRAITEPIAMLVSAIRRVAKGDLEVVAPVRTNDEIGELAQSFNTMVPRLRDHLRLSHSLDLAREVQSGLLPQSPPSVPGLDIAARSIYCDETGGDYYDFFEITADGSDQAALAIAIGDVTGHGIAAALLMATARSLIRMRLTMPGPMPAHFQAINRQLVNDTDVGRFMTLMFLVLEPDTLHARWIGAGHDPVIVYDPACDAFTELAGEDLPLGIQADWTFHEHACENLLPGMILVLGTDGIWEMRDHTDALYGKDRLKACIKAHSHATADAIADAILDDINLHRADSDQLDDVTLVVIKLKSA